MGAAVSKQVRLDQIKADILKQNVCPELAKQATQLVFGDGNPNADIVFIGEAPGKNEDIQGIPFVGAAGKFLNEMLEMIGMNRDDIYITNIVKYRPPNNRDPLPEEKQAFLPFLEAQLQVIQPKLVITLGRHSLNCFLPDLKISAAHGRALRMRWKLHGRVGGQDVDGSQGAREARTEPYTKYGEGALELATQQSATKASGLSSLTGQSDSLILVILPLFHPAAALYNGGMRQTLIDDFVLIPTIIKKIS